MYIHIFQLCLGLSVCHSTSFSALYINNQWTTSPWIIKEGSARCYAKSPTVQDAFWPRSQTPPQPLGIRNTIYCLELTSQSKWTQCAWTCCFWTVSWGSHQTVSCKFSFTFRWPRPICCCHTLPVSTWPLMCVADFCISLKHMTVLSFLPTAWTNVPIYCKNKPIPLFKWNCCKGCFSLEMMYLFML